MAEFTCVPADNGFTRYNALNNRNHFGLIAAFICAAATQLVPPPTQRSSDMTLLRSSGTVVSSCYDLYAAVQLGSVGILVIMDMTLIRSLGRVNSLLH